VQRRDLLDELPALTLLVVQRRLGM